MKQALLSIDENGKAHILEDELEMAKIFEHHNKLNQTDEEKQLQEQKETELLKLEGRVLLLLLTTKYLKLFGFII